MAATCYQLSELAQRFALQHRGADTTISGVGTLTNASASQLSFLANPRYRALLANTQAAAVIVRSDDADACTVPCLIAGDPYAAYAKIATLFERVEVTPAGIHASAVIDASAEIDTSAHIGPHVFIGARSRIAAGAVIGPGCVIGEDCEVGESTQLVARVTLVRRVRIGQRTLIHPGAVIGADGFGIAFSDGQWLKVPQLGGVQIGSDCEIGANTTIDRGAIEDTVLEDDVRLDNQIQIGHNVIIGAHTAIAGCAAVAGSSRIGRYCLIGGGAGIVGHIELADRVVIAAMSLVSHSIKEPGEYASGTAIQDKASWRRNAARFKQLDAIVRKIKNDPKE